MTIVIVEPEKYGIATVYAVCVHACVCVCGVRVCVYVCVCVADPVLRAWEQVTHLWR